MKNLIVYITTLTIFLASSIASSSEIRNNKNIILKELICDGNINEIKKQNPLDLKNLESNPLYIILSLDCKPNLPTIEYLLKETSLLNLNKLDIGNLLVLATLHGKPEILQYLIAQGFDANSKNIDGATALMVSTVNCNLDLAKILLSSKADPYLKDNYGISSIDRIINRSYPNNPEGIKKCTTYDSFFKKSIM